MYVFKITWKHERGHTNAETVLARDIVHCFESCKQLLKQKPDAQSWRLSGIDEMHAVILLPEIVAPSSGREGRA